MRATWTAAAVGVLGTALAACDTSVTEVDQVTGAQVPAHDVPGRGHGGLGVEGRAGECVHAGMYHPSGEPHPGAPRSRAAAVAQVADDEPHLRGVRQDQTDPDRYVKVVAGRRVAAVRVRAYPVKSDGYTMFHVTASEFAAGCDYVNPAHLEASRTVPEGVTPGEAGGPEAAPADAGAAEADRRLP